MKKMIEVPQVQEEDEDEDEERYGHTPKNGRRVPWDLLLDREIKLDATTPKPPPPKLLRRAEEEKTMRQRGWKRKGGGTSGDPDQEGAREHCGNDGERG